MIIEKQFRDIIEARLDVLQWSRADLAREMSVSRQMITDYLNGRTRPGPDVIERFFNAVGLVPRLEAEPAPELVGAK